MAPSSDVGRERGESESCLDVDHTVFALDGLCTAVVGATQRCNGKRVNSLVQPSGSVGFSLCTAIRCCDRARRACAAAEFRHRVDHPLARSWPAFDPDCAAAEEARDYHGQLRISALCRSWRCRADVSLEAQCRSEVAPLGMESDEPRCDRHGAPRDSWPGDRVGQEGVDEWVRSPKLG